MPEMSDIHNTVHKFNRLQIKRVHSKLSIAGATLAVAQCAVAQRIKGNREGCPLHRTKHGI